MILLALMLPLSYLATKDYGIVGTAAATLISITVYNLIRILFLWKKFGLFPFTIKSLYTVLLAGACFAACFYAFREMEGIVGIIIRSLVFLILYCTAAFLMKLSPDIKPVLVSIQKRLTGKRT
jgi:hypothetical protein